jgi:hypothetical protein
MSEVKEQYLRDMQSFIDKGGMKFYSETDLRAEHKNSKQKALDTFRCRKLGSSEIAGQSASKLKQVCFHNAYYFG